MKPGTWCLLASLWLAVGAIAQPLDLAGDPADLARVALGSDPGQASVAVWRDGHLRAATVRHDPGRAVGEPAPLVADTAPALYEIGSISKIFTGLLLAQAVERGDLALGDTLGGLLQGKVVFVSPDVAAITLEQLVTHRSCLPRQFGELRTGAASVAQIRSADRAALWAALAGQKIARAAPCPALYSNYAMAVLGELLAERNGRSWGDLVRERITGPLDLADTVVQLGDKGSRLAPGHDGRRTAPTWDMQAFAGAGGLRSSVQELARFGQALVQGRAGPFGAAAERMVAPLAAYRGGQIGYAVFVSGPPARRTLSHDGQTGGYRALLVLYPDSGEVMAALVANSQAPVSRLGGRLAATRYPVGGVAMAIDPMKLADYRGTFRVDRELALVCVVQHGALHVRSTGGVFRAYLPVAPDVFTRPDGGAQLSFARRDGVVVAATLEQSGNTTTAQRSTEAAPDDAVLAPGAVAAYVGRYVSTRAFRSTVEFDVEDLDGQMVVRSSAFPRQPVFPMAGRADRFHYDGGRAELQFERDASGRPVALVLHENGDMRAVRAAPGS